MQEQWGQDLEAVIRVLQTALAPAFLLAGVASLLNVLTARFARAIDRARELRRDHASADASAKAAIEGEFALTLRRKHLSRIAIALSASGAAIICLMVGLLFIMGLTVISFAWLIVAMFALAMALIAGSLGVMLFEISLASHDTELSLPESGTGETKESAKK